MSVDDASRVEFSVKINWRLANQGAGTRYREVPVQAQPLQPLRASIEEALRRDNSLPPGQAGIDWSTTTLQQIESINKKTKRTKMQSDRIDVTGSLQGARLELIHCEYREETPPSDAGSVAAAEHRSQRRSASPVANPRFDEVAGHEEADHDEHGMSDSCPDIDEEGEDGEESGRTGVKAAAAESAARTVAAAAPGSTMIYQNHAGNFKGNHNSGIATGAGSSVRMLAPGGAAPAAASSGMAAKPKLESLSDDADPSDPAVDLSAGIKAMLLEPSTLEEMLCGKVNTMISAARFAKLLQERMKSVVKLHRVPYIVKEGFVTPEQQKPLLREDIEAMSEFCQGTAFIVSPGILMTNSHVLPAFAAAIHSETRVLFDFDDDKDPRDTHEALPNDAKAVGWLRPDRYFWANAECDCALVAFTYPADEQAAADKPFEPQNPLLRPPIALTHRLVNQELKEDPRLYIIQHPKGQPKILCMHAARSHLSSQTPGRLLHSSDTEKGSSGSPVLNAKFELVALHRARAPVYVSFDKKGKMSLADEKSSHKKLPLNEAVYASALWAKLFDVHGELKAKAQAAADDVEKAKLAQEIDILGRVLLTSPAVPNAKKKALATKG